MSEALARRIEEHLDDFAEYERPDASQLPEDRERALEARVAAVGVVLDAIDAAGYKVMSRELAEKLRTNNNERLERIRVLERQVRESEEEIGDLRQQLVQVNPATGDAGVTRAKMSNPVSRIQTAGRMLADLKNKADASRADDADPAPGDPDEAVDDPAEGYEAQDAERVVKMVTHRHATPIGPTEEPRYREGDDKHSHASGVGLLSWEDDGPEHTHGVDAEGSGLTEAYTGPPLVEEDAQEGESSSAKVRCCECGYYGPWQEFPAAGSAYHDLRCPKCSTTNLDTSECLAEDSGYGYGKGNTLESM